MTSIMVPKKNKWHTGKRMKKMFTEEKRLLIIFDILAVNLSYGIALWLRFDLRFSSIPKEYLNGWLHGIPINTALVLGIFALFHLYRSVWEFAGYVELINTLGASLLLAVLNPVYMTLFIERMPISYYLLGWMMVFGFTLGIRFSYRFLCLIRTKRSKEHDGKNILIIGAGAAGRMLLREIKRSEHIHDNVCCFIDDDEQKKGCYIAGVPIAGTRTDIKKAVDTYNITKIIFAIPSADVREKSLILNICKDTGCELQTVPGIYQLVNNEVSVEKLREVSVEELLGREPVEINLKEIMGYVSHEVVLVTGGGGSIGSELCRQIAANNPKQLIIFDIYENNAYEIQMELSAQYPELDIVTLIGSVRNTHRINQIFRDYKPQIVFHAAAHKHVPLMENSPNEAIKNNVIGTYNTAKAADSYQTERFVLISTDKAVNPTNVMGASKRLCEMIVQYMNQNSSTVYAAVRFGNILGSNGSVIPLFKKQIAKGGPVTVTDKRIIRYFMTIPEAVSLVLQAGAYAKGGEIFVLNMGEPVKIDDLARNLIKLSGYEPDIQIPIQYVGLRPGEKLFEETWYEDDNMKPTENKLIFVGKPIQIEEDEFVERLMKLKEIAYEDGDEIREVIKDMVDTYQYRKKESAGVHGNVVEISRKVV